MNHCPSIIGFWKKNMFEKMRAKTFRFRTLKKIPKDNGHHCYSSVSTANEWFNNQCMVALWSNVSEKTIFERFKVCISKNNFKKCRQVNLCSSPVSPANERMKKHQMAASRSGVCERNILGKIITYKPRMVKLGAARRAQILTGPS